MFQVLKIKYTNKSNFIDTRNLWTLLIRTQGTIHKFWHLATLTKIEIKLYNINYFSFFVYFDYYKTVFSGLDTSLSSQDLIPHIFPTIPSLSNLYWILT